MLKAKLKKNIRTQLKTNKLITDKGSPTRLTTELSSEAMQTVRLGACIVKMLKEIKCQPRTLYLVKLVFNSEPEMAFPDQPTLREFVAFDSLS